MPEQQGPEDEGRVSHSVIPLAIGGVAQAVDDGFADGGQVDAVFHDDVELNGNGFVLVIDHVDALAHGLPPQQMDQTVRHGAVGHALHTEAVGGSHAGNVGKNSAGDGDLALFRMKFQHRITFLSAAPTQSAPPEHNYQAIIIYDFFQKYKIKKETALFP